MANGATTARNSLYGFEMREPDLRRSDERKSYDIKQLWQRSHEIVALALQGFKQTEISKTLNISPATVSNTLNSKLGMEKLSSMRGERDEEAIAFNAEIIKLRDKALKVYHDIFDNDSISPNLKKATADTIVMDIAGHRAPTRTATVSAHYTATPDEIEAFKQRGLQAARESGMLIEIKPEAIE